MIGQLITTLIMALGVATGNVSSNVYKGGNAFNNEIETRHEKPINKLTENITLIEINNLYTVATNTTNGDNFNKTIKYYFSDGNNQPATAHYTNAYVNIYNTTYQYQEGYGRNGRSYCYITTVMQIDNYSESTQNDINFSIKYAMSSNNPTQQTNVIKVAKEMDDYILEYIDQTLTYKGTGSRIFNQIYFDEEHTTATKKFENVQLNNIWTQQTLPDQTIIYTTQVEFNITIQNLEAHSNKNLALLMGISIDQNGAAYITMDEYRFVIEGYVEIVEINYEIIDIPGLMYTILTMPFSFISTAFNLTVFPGTPYALNFGNLFLTIVALFILMWLLRKVFK